MKKPGRADRKRPDTAGAEGEHRSASPISHDQLEQRVQELSETLATRSRELEEALEYQAATSEVLNAISRSPSDAQPVFDTIVQNAVSICGSLFANVFRYDGEMLHFAASHHVDRRYVELLEDKYPMRPDLTQISGRVVLSGSVVHLEDALADPEYDKRFPAALGWRRMLGVPMLGEGGLLGVIVVGWAEAGPVPRSQEEQLKSFADQAVIAVDNARLFNELQESLEFQTAASDLLGVISRSPSDVKPVFDAIVDHAVRLCDAEFSRVTRYHDHDGVLHMEAFSNMRPEETEIFRNIFPRPPDRSFIVGRAFLDGVPVQVEDVQVDPDYDASILEILKTTSACRTYLGIPILRHGKSIGVIGLGRREAKPFTNRQIKLLQTFAEQAVIAIENARQFAEIQDKSRQVAEQAAELAEWNRTLESRVNEQVEQLGRMSKLTRFLSPKISDLIMSGEVDDPLATRRAEITVVEVDLRGFTAFTEMTDPEEVMTVLREYYAELGKAITAYDGTIEHFAGDGAMILFNAPVPVEDHELQAVRMALQMRASVGELTANWRKLGISLGCGAGIAAGYATLGTIGFEERLDYGAIGTVCNLAARLCNEAADGQILISPRVFARTEDWIEATSVGELTMKGFHRPVEAYELVGLREPGLLRPSASETTLRIVKH